MPGNPFPILAFICLVPLGLALHGATRVQSMLYGFMFGFFGWISSTNGLATGLSSYLQLSSIEVLVYMLTLCFFLAIPYGLFGLLYGNFQWMKSPFGPYKTAACLTILISILPSPIPVAPAHSLYVFPLYTQMLDIGGEPLLLFVLILVNWLFVDLILRLKNQQQIKTSLIATVMLITVTTSYGYFRLSQYHYNESNIIQDDMITIASIQPNIDLPKRLISSSTTKNPINILLQMSEQALTENSEVDLLVWPEIPAKLNCERESENNILLTEFAKLHNTHLLINCEQAGRHSENYNTALFIAPNGKVSTYHKQKLFPFAEYLPGEKAIPLLRKIMPGVSRYLSGKEIVVFKAKENLFVFAAICYEILFTDHIRKFIEKGGNLLVNPANDAWFANSRIPDFLISASVYQSIQYRIPSIRISNSGNSLFVKASGELITNTRTANFEKKTTISRIYVPKDRSPYTYLGNNFLYLLMLLWITSFYYDKSQSRKADNVRSRT